MPRRGTEPMASSATIRLLFWESTARCNLRCLHCRRLDTEAAAPPDLTTTQVRGLLDSLATLADPAGASRPGGRPIFVFSGGEPLLRDDWEALAAHAHGRGLTTALATNGTLIDANLAGRIAAADFHRVSVSFDGADAATHDAFRGVAGAFEAALAGVRHLRQARVSVQVNATIAGHNHHQLDALFNLARSLDAAALHLFLLVPVGCGVQIGQSHQLSPQRYEEILGWLCDRHLAEGGTGPHHGRPPAGQGLELKATCAPHFYRLAAQRGLRLHTRGCLCGVAVAFVSHSGEVFPCGYLPVSCGNVTRSDFAEIWKNAPVFADLRDFATLTGKCGACAFKGLCGGCRARAFAQSGDYLAEEPACSYQPRLVE